MTAVGEFFAVTLAVALIFAAVPRDRVWTLIAWLGLVLSWAVTILVAHNQPEAVFIYAALDALMGVAAVGIARRTGLRWPLVLATLFAVACAMHVLWYAFEEWGPPDARRLGRYYIGINIVYLLQIFTVSGPGVCRGVAAFFHILSGPPAPAPSRGVARK